VLLYEMIMGEPPYVERHAPMKLFTAILRGGLPEGWRRTGLSAPAAELCAALLQRDAAARLGAVREGAMEGGQLALKWHDFFGKRHDFDWLALEMRQLEPPTVPELSGPFDVSHFDPAADDPVHLERAFSTHVDHATATNVSSEWQVARGQSIKLLH